MIEAIALLKREASSDRETADLHERNARALEVAIKAQEERLAGAWKLVKQYRNKADEWETAAALLEKSK